ncbi:MAG: hypothetical protein P4L69_24370 [Desulfosporosinus sp.]|nr:hypothetical protein [Desulfosporosinus sp.]
MSLSVNVASVVQPQPAPADTTSIPTEDKSVNVTPPPTTETPSVGQTVQQA